MITNRKSDKKNENEDKTKVKTKTKDTPAMLKAPAFEKIVRQQAEKSSSKNEVILLVNDIKYKAVFLNWLVLAEHHQINNYLMIALDAETNKFCQEIGFPVYFFEEVFGAKRLNVAEIWAQRIKIILGVLQMGVGVHMIDSDAFMLQNPYPYLNPELYDIESLGGKLKQMNL